MKHFTLIGWSLWISKAGDEGPDLMGVVDDCYTGDGLIHFHTPRGEFVFLFNENDPHATVFINKAGLKASLQSPPMH